MKNEIQIKTKPKDCPNFTCGICEEECEKQIFLGVYISVCINCMEKAIALFRDNNQICREII